MAPYTRWFNDWALLVGWAVGIAFGTGMAAAVNLTPTFPLQLAGDRDGSQSRQFSVTSAFRVGD